jgi:hypothetical protein
MSYLNYNFAATTSACAGTSPLTITFDPTGINVGTGWLSEIKYEFPDKTINRYYTFSTYADALTGAYKDFDSRVPVTYTFPGQDIADDGSTVLVASITAVVGPSFTTTVYKLSANIVLQYLTQNPTGTSAPYAFGEVHLLKTRVWGPSNSQLYVLETKNPNYILLNFSGGSQVSYITTILNNSN